MQANAENRRKHLINKTKTSQENDETRIVPFSTDSDQADEPNMANKYGDRWEQLSKLRTMLDHTLMQFKRNWNSQIAEEAEKTIIEDLKMCVLEELHENARFREPFSKWLVVGDILYERTVADHMQKATVKAGVHPATIKAVADALLKNNVPMASIATSVSN